ncbi:hypothetical protein F4779DRAFT_623067 [Xylariaceae sp. FL0662B]|nr:hypothetical protein F4779DRAFT_623067 [Xylariaceae sp. FL0662B]
MSLNRLTLIRGAAGHAYHQPGLLVLLFVRLHGVRSALYSSVPLVLAPRNRNTVVAFIRCNFCSFHHPRSNKLWSFKRKTSTINNRQHLIPAIDAPMKPPSEQDQQQSQLQNARKKPTQSHKHVLLVRSIASPFPVGQGFMKYRPFSVRPMVWSTVAPSKSTDR